MVILGHSEHQASQGYIRPCLRFVPWAPVIRKKLLPRYSDLLSRQCGGTGLRKHAQESRQTESPLTLLHLCHSHSLSDTPLVLVLPHNCCHSFYLSVCFMSVRERDDRTVLFVSDPTVSKRVPNTQQTPKNHFQKCVHEWCSAPSPQTSDGDAHAEAACPGSSSIFRGSANTQLLLLLLWGQQKWKKSVWDVFFFMYLHVPLWFCIPPIAESWAPTKEDKYKLL